MAATSGRCAAAGSVLIAAAEPESAEGGGGSAGEGVDPGNAEAGADGSSVSRLAALGAEPARVH